MRRLLDCGAPGSPGKNERSTDIGYVVQTGPLKDLSLRWRNSTYTDGADENRVIVSYLYKF